MKTKCYGQTKCPCCDKPVTSNGMGYNSHMMAHVRRGEAEREMDALGLWNYRPKKQHEPGSTNDPHLLRTPMTEAEINTLSGKIADEYEGSGHTICYIAKQAILAALHEIKSHQEKVS